jgi:dinuclear metal center YbgI/SA1388 family protein
LHRGEVKARIAECRAGWYFRAMKLREIISFLEKKAPPVLQESYDNSGLITGNPDMDITGAVICLDSTPEVIAEAKAKGCNLVIAHHPIIFSGLKRLTGKNYIEKTIIDAIRSDIAIYAIHTNLDNVMHGVNRRIADVIGLSHLSILQPKSGLLYKIVVFVPADHMAQVRQAMFDAGAGSIGKYDSCSFQVSGTGNYRAGEGANPYAGTAGEFHEEMESRVEVIADQWSKSEVVRAMLAAHPYEEVAYDVYRIENELNSVGSGLVGQLPAPEPVTDFLMRLKTVMKVGCIRHTAPVKKSVQKIAVCGGSGSFLLESAVRSGADVLITADFKYHQFFDADGRILIADIGHYESEQFTMNLLNDWFSQKFPNFATHLTDVVTNPVHYL